MAACSDSVGLFNDVHQLLHGGGTGLGCTRGPSKPVAIEVTVVHKRAD